MFNLKKIVIMNTRICIVKNVKDSIAMPCTVTELIEAMHSKKVSDIAQTIREIQSSGQYDKDLINAYKQQLPAITPHACQFDHNKRENKYAQASGLVMLDVDNVDFELRTGLINMVQSSPLCGKANEDASAHLQQFLEICNTIIIRGVTPEAI